MARTTAQAFDHFYDTCIKPTEYQYADVKAKKDNTEKHLKSAFPGSSDLPLNRVVLIGSADRGTLTQPVNDVDVLAQFTNKDNVFQRYRYSSGDFLQRLRRALDAETAIKTIGARGQAVRLFYASGAHVDIAPVFKCSTSGYALPAGNGGWITTDPEAQARWYASRRQTIGENLSRVVRFSKRWNQVHSNHLSSFHLEVMVASLFKTVGGDTRNALSIFFSDGMTELNVNDPAGYSGNLSTYLTLNERSDLRSRLSTASDRAIRAIREENSGNHAEAKRLWRIELGSDFSLN